MNKLAVILTVLMTCFPVFSFASISILDTLPITVHSSASAVGSASISYTPPAGSSEIEVVQIDLSSGSTVVTATQNGSSMTCTKFVSPPATAGSGDLQFQMAAHWYCWMAAPTNGTLALTFSVANSAYDFGVLTLGGAQQTGQPDAIGARGQNGTFTFVTATTTPVTSGDLITDWTMLGGEGGSSHGAGQTEYVNGSAGSGLANTIYSSYESTTTISTAGLTENFASINNSQDIVLEAWAPAPSVSPTTIYPTYWDGQWW